MASEDPQQSVPAPGGYEPRSYERRSYERQRVARSHLPRLDPARYRSHAAVFWTHTIDRRATGWLTDTFHHHWRLILLHSCARYRLVCPVYVLMPDHAHLLWLGCAPESDQRLATTFLRKHTDPALAPASWQHQAHDHVLRPHERERGAFTATAHYILENPVRAALVSDRSTYPYLGCCIPGYPELALHTPDYWDRFWRVYAYLMDASE